MVQPKLARRVLPPITQPICDAHSAAQCTRIDGLDSGPVVIGVICIYA